MKDWIAANYQMLQSLHARMFDKILARRADGYYTSIRAVTNKRARPTLLDLTEL